MRDEKIKRTGLDLYGQNNNDDKNKETKEPTYRIPDPLSLGGAHVQRSGNLQGNAGYLGLTTTNFIPKLIINVPNAYAPTYDDIGMVYDRPCNYIPYSGDITSLDASYYTNNFYRQSIDTQSTHFCKLKPRIFSSQQPIKNISLYYDELERLLLEGVFV